MATGGQSGRDAVPFMSSPFSAASCFDASFPMMIRKKDHTTRCIESDYSRNKGVKERRWGKDRKRMMDQRTKRESDNNNNQSAVWKRGVATCCLRAAISPRSHFPECLNPLPTLSELLQLTSIDTF